MWDQVLLCSLGCPVVHALLISVYWWDFRTLSPYLAQLAFSFFFLPSPPHFFSDRVSCLASVLLYSERWLWPSDPFAWETKPRLLSMLGKHYTIWATSLVKTVVLFKYRVFMGCSGEAGSFQSHRINSFTNLFRSIMAISFPWKGKIWVQECDKHHSVAHEGNPP